MYMHFYRFYLSLPVSARNSVAGDRRPSSSSLPRRAVGWSDGQRRNHGPRTQKWPFKLPSKGRSTKPTARYLTPVTNCVGDFSSLREAGLKRGGGLIGRDAAKIARFTIFRRA
jgi:hypothetical protein